MKDQSAMNGLDTICIDENEVISFSVSCVDECLFDLKFGQKPPC